MLEESEGNGVDREVTQSLQNIWLEEGESDEHNPQPRFFLRRDTGKWRGAPSY